MVLPVQLALVFAVAACVGMVINWAIYRLAWDKRCFSPLGPKHPEASPRKPMDFVPIFGWLSLKREEKIFGTAYWTRPFAIEFLFASAITGLYFWEFQGGLHGLALDAGSHQYLIWFLLHSFLIMLLVVATFIDFDEKTIPDQITITGTLFALAYAALIPISRLPIHDGAGGFQAIQLNSPNAFPEWASSSNSLWIGMACFVFWCLALLPWPYRLKTGKFGSIKYFWAILLRPPRKNSTLPERKRSALLYVCPLMAFAGVGFIAYVHFSMAAENWEALMSALMGMTFGLVFVWLIRLIAGHALAKEAMGFGDVTLLAMIGAFMGWQTALLTFAFAPFAAIFIAIGQLLVSKKTDLAFGPYLSLAAILILVGWSAIWNQWAQQNVFQIGNLVLMVIGASLVLMYLMLAGWSALRNRFEA